MYRVDITVTSDAEKRVSQFRRSSTIGVTITSVAEKITTNQLTKNQKVE